MSDAVEHRDDEKERRTNMRLAVGIGVFSATALFLFYIAIFIAMFLKPGLLFSIMPVPDIPGNAVSDGQHVYFLSQRPDMSKISITEKKEPPMQHFLTRLEGDAPGKPQEVPAYASAAGGMGRIVFLYEGGFRTFDGTSWTETAADAVGTEPRGLLTPEGLFVLSSFEDGMRLYRITDAVATPVPLPGELATDGGETACSCPQMIWSGNMLGLIWSDEETISWASWNGTAWSQPATFPNEGAFRVLAGDDAVYVFRQQGDGPASWISLSVLTEGSWTEPRVVQLPGSFMDWFVFMQQGKPMLLVRQLTAQLLYAVKDGGFDGPVRLGGPIRFAPLFSGVAALTAVSYVLFVLVVYGYSAVIDRYKNRYCTINGVRCEFASLFRRFAAYLIDTGATLLPVVIGGVLFFRSSEQASDNPFLVMLVVFILTAFLFLVNYLYHSLFEGLYGATPGKRLCGIVVLKADLSPCGLGPAFLRNLLRIVDGFSNYLVAAIAVAGTMRWQRLGDLAADTVVVRRTKG